MAERDYVVDKLRLTYEGLFSVRELYNLITEWYEENNWDKNEKKNFEAVEPDGRNIEIWMEPWRTMHAYVKKYMRVRIIMSKVKDVEVEKDGAKLKLNQGKVQMVIDAWVQTDLEASWEGKPFYFFIRTMFNKFFLRPMTSGYESELKADANQFYQKVKAYLNMQRYN